MTNPKINPNGPPIDPSGAAPPRKLADVLRSDGEDSKLYALLDAAKIEDLLEALEEYEPPNACMFAGKVDASVARVAPYIVELEPDSAFTPWLLERYWGKDAGVFLFSESELKGVRKHLKQFTLARLPSGEQAFFRFYDPRVLRSYLPTCTDEEIEQWLGDVVECFWVESDSGHEALEFTRMGGSVGARHAIEFAADRA